MLIRKSVRNPYARPSTTPYAAENETRYRGFAGRVTSRPRMKNSASVNGSFA